MAHPEGPFNATPFDHRQHVKFAWTVLEDSSEIEAVDIVGSEIREYAALHAPGKYHETLTEFWVRLVAHTRGHAVAGDGFDEHVARFQILTNRNAHKLHYSSTLIASARARQEFVEPDLLALP